MDSLICLEVFAGSCRLSSALTGRERQSFRLFQVDLLQPSSHALIVELIRTCRIFYVNSAPPCSTSSQAREIPLTNGSGLKPLRSSDEPDGISGLSMTDKVRVSNANKLYDLTAEVLEVAQTSGVLWSVENPAGSHSWNTSPMMAPLRKLKPHIHFVQFYHCCFGGDRMKLTLLWTNLARLGTLGMLCSPKLAHVLKKWGRTQSGSFATSLETAYPLGLCRQWAGLVLQESLDRGFALVDTQVAVQQSPRKSTPSCRLELFAQIFPHACACGCQCMWALSYLVIG